MKKYSILLLICAALFSGFSLSGGPLSHDANAATVIVDNYIYAAPAAGCTPSSTNLQNWLDASDAATISYSSGLLQWADKSGNARNFAVPPWATATNNPSSGTRTQNGLNVLDFDGSNSFMFGTTYSNISAGDNTIIAVIKSDATGDDFWIAGHNGGSAVWGIRQTNFGTKWGAMNNGQTEASASLDTTNPHIIVIRRTGTTLDLIVDGTLYTSTNASNVNIPNNVILGREEAAGGRGYVDGFIAEWVAYNTYLSNADVNTIANCWETKWATPSWVDLAANDNYLRYASNDNAEIAP